MEKTATIPVKDLAPEARDWIAGLLQIELSESDECTLTLHRSPNGPTQEQRRKAWATIERILDKAGENMKNVSDQDFGNALDEAMRTVRPRSQRTN